MDYRLTVHFKNGENSYSIPGYFAADGNAANSGAESGKVWRVNFTPPATGVWDFEVSFKTGKNISISDDPFEGSPVKKVDGKINTKRELAKWNKDKELFEIIGSKVRDINEKIELI